MGSLKSRNPSAIRIGMNFTISDLRIIQITNFDEESNVLSDWTSDVRHEENQLFGWSEPFLLMLLLP